MLTCLNLISSFYIRILLKTHSLLLRYCPDSSNLSFYYAYSECLAAVVFSYNSMFLNDHVLVALLGTITQERNNHKPKSACRVTKPISIYRRALHGKRRHYHQATVFCFLELLCSWSAPIYVHRCDIVELSICNAFVICIVISSN